MEFLIRWRNYSHGKEYFREMHFPPKNLQCGSKKFAYLFNKQSVFIVSKINVEQLFLIKLF